MTPAGFPHSEIPGSKDVKHLPRAYRSLPRLSSPSDAKASTRCSCQLILEITSFHPYSIVKEPLPLSGSCRLIPVRIHDTVMPSLSIRQEKSKLEWWSWTGLNRLPPACKAGALPGELQPPPDSWWAWKDLNFRPHAYQACALTT